MFKPAYDMILELGNGHRVYLSPETKIELVRKIDKPFSNVFGVFRKVGEFKEFSMLNCQVQEG